MEFINLRILIADDGDTDRLILKAIVQKQGHKVYTAKDGVEAIDVFSKEDIDIVLLDALMPNVDGFEAARKIKKLSGERLVPIIFLTSLKDAMSLADCLDAGGDDFLTKPYNRVILQAKIQAFARMRKLHEKIQQQRDEISSHHDHLLQEQIVAKAVFDNIAHPGRINAKNIKYLLSPVAVFNGDMLLAARKPSGGMYVLLGDFTGHGLPAAIGAMPVSEIFYGMTKKGFSMQEILREINKKLKAILPVGVFCCCCMLNLEFREKIASVWMGGLPDIFLYRLKEKQVVPVKSRSLPLGVLSDDQFNINVENFNMDYGDRFYLWSDGIHEETNDDDEMFGEERLLKVFHDNQQHESLFDDILKAVELFVGSESQEDDHTLVEVVMLPEEEIDDIKKSNERQLIASQSNMPIMDWVFTYEMKPATLRTFNPLPLLTHILMEIPGIHPYSGKIYMILSELYSNALEHGVMGLSSDLKGCPDGFNSYYRQREELLKNLEDGFVIVRLAHKPIDHGGELSICVVDSGPGFDYKSKINGNMEDKKYCGRGIPLIRNLCKSFEYIGKGNKVEAVFQWSFGD